MISPRLAAPIILTLCAGSAARAQVPAGAPRPPLVQGPQIELEGQVSADAEKDADEFVLRIENLRLKLIDEDVEIRADRALLWVDRDLFDLMRAKGGGVRGDPLHVGPELPPSEGRPPLREADRRNPLSVLSVGLHELYAEGHVFLREGGVHVVFAERLYQHLIERRGIVLEADLFRQSIFSDRPITLHVRAQELRNLGTDQAIARQAQFTTCPYGQPHYHVASDTLTLQQRKGAEGNSAVTASLQGNTLEYADVPVLPLPDFTARLDAGDSLPLKKVRAGHSSRYGTFLETLWGAPLDDAARSIEEEFALEKPLELDWEADVDLYSRRGAGLGPGLAWNVPGLIDGEIGGYWIHDHANKDISTNLPVERTDRGRAYFRNRLIPAEHWRLDTEAQYFSDPSFQPEFFEREFKEEKDPESYAHLVRQEETTRLRFLYRNRLNDFQSQVDSLPQASFDQVGEPLLKLPLPDFLELDGQPNWLVLTDATDVNNMRLQPADFLGQDSERVVRADSLLELSTTLPFGPLSFRPFTAGRVTGWDRSDVNENALGRVAGSAGARAELMLHRNYDVWSSFLGLDGLRHIVLLDADYSNIYAVSRDPSRFIQIDEVDALDVEEVYVLAVRQRLQTHHGRTLVNFTELDLELPLYPHAQRDNPSVDLGGPPTTVGPLRYDFVQRIDLSHPWFRNMSLFAEGEWNFHDETMDVANTGFTLQPEPDWTTMASYRVVRGQFRVVTGEIDWLVTDKWSIALLEQYDLRVSAGLEHRIELRRHGHDFTFALAFARDLGDGNTSLTFTLYPSFFRRGRSERTLSGGRGEQPALNPSGY